MSEKNLKAQEYHNQRWPFVLTENAMILGQRYKGYSHRQMMKELGMSQETIKEILESNPRGYFLNNMLVIYQGDNQDKWSLKKSNYPLVKQYYNELKNIFGFNKDTKIFFETSLKPENIWEYAQQISQDFFSE